MDIISRKEAKSQGLKKYYTGKSCKNNHMAERYTESGACYGCILESKSLDISAVKTDVKTVKNAVIFARAAALGQLLPVKFRVYQWQVRQLVEIAWGFTAMRYEHINRGDVYNGRAGTNLAGGTMLYTLNVHPDDVDAIRAYSNQLLSSQTPAGFAAKQAAILAQQASQLLPGEDSTPPINFS